MNFLGLDIGTTNIAVYLYDENKTIVYSVKHTNDSSMAGKEFEDIQNPNRIWIIVSDLLESIPRTLVIDGIGISNQMHGMVYVAQDGSALSPLYTWQDARADQPYHESTYVEYVYDTLGYRVPSGYALMTHYYHIINNEVPKNAYRILDIGNFIACKISGSIPACVHPSQAHAFGFYNVDTNAFDTQVLAKMEVHLHLLPTVKETLFPVVHKNDIPIYAPIGDNQAGFLGTTGGDEKAVLINVGTSGQISFIENNQENNTIHALARGWERRPFIQGNYLQVASTLCAGKSIDIWVDFVSMLVCAFSSHAGSNNTNESIKKRIYDELKSLTIAEHKNILTFCTQFYGSRHESKDKASLKHISAHNFNFTDISTSLIRGIADELYKFWELLPMETRKHKHTLCLTGGAFNIPLVRSTFERRFAFDNTHVFSCDENMSEDASMGAAQWARMGKRLALQ